MKKTFSLITLTLLLALFTLASWDYSLEPMLVNAPLPSSPPQKVVYLTFDDGPSAVTESLLDMLKEKGVQATFFVTGNNNEQYLPLLKRMSAEGHTIGLHSQTHRIDQIYQSLESFSTDLTQIDQLVQQETGVCSKIYRFPGGSRSYMMPAHLRMQFINLIESQGYHYFDWTAVSGDDTSTVYPADYLAKNILTNAKGQGIIIPLFHDAGICTTTEAAAAIVIDQLSAEGYVFLPLTADTPLLQFDSLYPE